MSPVREPLPAFLEVPRRAGSEVSVTGRWTAVRETSRRRRSPDPRLLDAWETIHDAAIRHPGVLQTEVNPVVGEDAVLAHHVFRDTAAMVSYFETAADDQLPSLTRVATPQLHLVRGAAISAAARETVAATGVPIAFSELVFGYDRAEQLPDPATAIQVTAKWTCASRDEESVEELATWWQRVGTDAYSSEEGLLTFEAYRVVGESALIIHETFADSSELRFHLTKGTADRYKDHIDRVAHPEAYYFRGPVSWSIRTYSRFMHLPATYSQRGSTFTRV